MDLSDFYKHPIIQAPMAGGATTPQLVAAVSEAGGIGSLAAPLLSAQALLEQAEKIRALTLRPFAINLFVLQPPPPTDEEIRRGIELLRPIWEPLGWGTLPLPQKW
ncbi:2-nitropropane dioxygenase, partial [Oxalobacteraceae bacterium OM1]